MNGTKVTAVAIVVAALALGVGYWLGRSSAPETKASDVSAEGRAAAPATSTSPGGKRVLYYRNPMGLPDTSPTPKKDSMGMDYIPVYEGEEPAAGGSDVKISPDRVQKLGVRVEAATRRDLARTVRAAGRVEPDERRTYAVAPRFEGWVEKLHVNATGQPVARGQPLFEVYSPELVAVQREYAIAARAEATLKDSPEETRAAMRQLAQSSLTRMRNWDVPEEQVRSIAEGGEVKRTVTFRSPVGGIVSERKALQGMRFMPGEMLYQIVDLSSVWVIADVFEQDLGLVKQGALAKIAINAYPERSFSGRVTYVYPNLSAETRTVAVRIELANPGMLLKPGMYASVELAGTGRARALTVPASAIIDSGVRRIVLVQTGEGRFAPREVRVGMRSDDHVEVLEGINEGDQVVTAANFLIDAESNLKAAIGGLTASQDAQPSSSGATPAASGKVGHQASGKVEAIDAKAGTATISHGPVASLKWPSMTMEFAFANPSQASALKPGTAIEFEFVERKPGEWVITKIAPSGTAKATNAPSAPAAAHKH
jgi:Cu(I)/Ag(I) efflux system membrane fusion protein